ncbi:hypothetical protein PsorP6_016920 [Peronosclerospora sorghi]|uniref:Uncharacterized protein n=1 Tax=Peronosclerospora sorghi TaxID=230839 RepID=A0ACC0WDU3_9STRA|nr:hypothetical protein PsorP6_016920 [Peronosclerospora sorghi]
MRATVKLREERTKASANVLDLRNVIVDSYSFKNKNVEHLNFLKLKLQRKFHAAHARHRRMLVLLENVWWEQLFGFHFLFISIAPSRKATCGSLAPYLLICNPSTLPFNSNNMTTSTSST